MAFADLKESLKENFQNLWSRVEENPTYNTLKEKFETLSPSAQRSIIGAICACVFLIFFMIPYSYYSASSDYNAEFSEKRGLLRELLRASRLAGDPSLSMRPLTRGEIEGKIRQNLVRFTLLPDQIEGVIDLTPADVGPSLAPAELQSVLVGLKLKKLNLRQIQEIGFQMQNTDTAVKLLGMSVTADEADPHYFNVVFKMVGYSMKESADDNAPVTEPDRPRGRRAQPADETEEPAAEENN